MQNIRIQVPKYTRVPSVVFQDPPNGYPVLGWRPGMSVPPQLLGLINESKERGRIQ